MILTPLVQKFAARLFEDAGERERFITALVEGVSASQALVWMDSNAAGRQTFERHEPLPWQPAFVDRLLPGQEPTRHQLHQDGAFYSLDFSSVFAGMSFLSKQIPSPVTAALDLCAAPGGKSSLAAAGLHPELLLCNEVIGKRHGALVSNLKRCRIPALVSCADATVFAKELPDAFPLVIIDAPCSGQSLFARGELAQGAFHPATINLNANRQKRIIANASQIVRPGGYLAYITCTFSRDEDEGVVEWCEKKFPFMKSVPIDEIAAHRSALSSAHGYRLYPQNGLGAGAFCALLRKEGAVPVDGLIPEIPGRFIRWRSQV